MWLTQLKFLFFVASLVSCGNVTLFRQPEGLVCLSYNTAKFHDLLGVCENLWRRAKIFPVVGDSTDCQTCRHFMKQKDYKILSQILAHSNRNVNVSSEYIKHMVTKLKSDSLVCALLERCENSVFTLPTLRFNAQGTCDDCKKIIDDVRALIQDDDTKFSAANFLKNAFCYKLPLQIIDVCKRAVDTYVGVITDLISSELESDTVCALFGVCPVKKSIIMKNETRPQEKAYSWINRPSSSGFEFFHSRFSNNEPILQPDSCKECITVFSRIRDQTKDSEFDSVLKNVVKNKLCESFGYFKSMCEAIVSRQVDSMIDNAGTMNITDLCFFFNQCKNELPSAVRPLEKKEYPISNQQLRNLNTTLPFVCPFCELIMKKVVDLTFNNMTGDALVWALEEVCKLLPSESRLKCIEYVDAYSTIIVKEVIAHTTPKFICTCIGLCDPFMNITVSSDSACKLCEVIVRSIYENLQTNVTKEAIIQDLELLCGYMANFKDQCIRLVDTYAGPAIDLLVKGIPPQEVCEKLGLCGREIAASPLRDNCAICEVIFSEVYSKLRDNITVDQIKFTLEKVCDYVPSGVADKCRSLVLTHTPAIIDLVMRKLTPRFICEELGVCYAHANPSPRVGKCEICKYIIDFIHSRLEDNTTADQIEEVIETVCDYIPIEALKLTCQEYVKAYTKALVDVVNGVPSKAICAELGFCSRNHPPRLPYRKNTSDVSRFHLRDDLTPVDQYRRPSVVRKYDCTKLSTREERCSNERLMRLCRFRSFCAGFARPLAFRGPDECSFCRNLLVQRLLNGASLVDCSVYVDRLDNARCENIRSVKVPGGSGLDKLETICKENHFCNTPTQLDPKPLAQQQKSRVVIGGDACLWGPSVSCRNADSAARCGVTDYCQQNVWPSQKVSSSPDCSRPLAELCPSPDLRFCDPSIQERCERRAVSDMPAVSAEDREMVMRICKDRPVSFCSDAKMVELCGMWEHCEAMGITSVPTLENYNSGGQDFRCRQGLSFACETYANALLCGQVELCRRQIWV